MTLGRLGLASLAAALVGGCGGTVSLGHGDGSDAGLPAAASGGSGGTSGADAGTGGAYVASHGCSHRAAPFTPTTSYAGYAWDGRDAATYSKLTLTFDALDATRVSGRVIFEVGVPSYAVEGDLLPSSGRAPRQGFDYTILSGRLDDDWLHLEVALSEPWCALCGEQRAYPAGGDAGSYACVPSGQAFQCLDPAACSEYSATDPATGLEQTFSAYVIHQLCTGNGPCGCTRDGCDACGFSESTVCAQNTRSFDLMLADGRLSGTLATGSSSLYVDAAMVTDGMVEITTDRLLALQNAACAGVMPGLETSCRYPVPATDEPDFLDLSRTSVVVTPTQGGQFLVVQTADESCRDGWHYVLDRSQIELCPNTCGRLGQDPGAGLAILLDCLAPSVQ